MNTQTRFKRILIKVSGESLMGNREFGIDSQAAQEVAQQLKLAKATGVQIAVIVGGGNIFRGMSASQKGFDRATADYMGMLATVMNGLALHDALISMDVDSRVQCALDMPQVAELFVRKKAIRHMEKDRIMIITAGTGNPYVTTDTGAALRALELKCDVVMKATKVDGVYDKDPMKFPDAKRYQTLKFKDAINFDAIQIMDTAAFSMCMENDMPVMIFKLFEDNNLVDAISGKHIGTYLANTVETKLI